MPGDDRLVERTPACERCVINDLGDFSHYENISGTTAHSGHALDTAVSYTHLTLPTILRV